MSPQTWQRVKSLYTAALEYPRERRADFLRMQAAEEPRVLAEALRLIAHDTPGASRFDALQIPSPVHSSRGGSLPAGALLAGRFEIRRFIAQGGFGEVYEAADLERGERIAVKVFRPEFATADHLAWLQREVRMARRIQHPNICRVFDFVQDPRAAFLTMELLEGETLAAYLRREGALSERRALPLVRQIVAALAAAHSSGVIHRDLKPGNILLVPRPDGPLRVVITDFGLARHVSSDRRTTLSAASSTAALGTPAYMAPEQIAGRAPGPAADIYSLGVVLHEMLTGELPFGNDSPLALAVRKTREVPVSPSQLAPALRPTWERAILRCLHPQPEKRFPDVRQLLAFLGSRSTAAVYAKLLRRTLGRAANFRLAAAAALLVLLAALAWRFAPASPTPAESARWERGLFALHAGQPLLALQDWASAAASPGRAPADLALAWRQLKLPARARQSLASLPSPLAGAADSLYRRAVIALLDGDTAAARRLLTQRAEAHPANGLFLADLAFLETIETGQPSPLWAKVITLRPDHPGAHLQFAALRAADDDEPGAERAFLAAETYFRALGQPDAVRAVAARRGLFRLASGHPDAAQNDLASFRGAALPDSGTGPCEHKILLQAGVQDGFALPPDPIPFRSPRFQFLPVFATHGKLSLFDQVAVDAPLAVSFPLPPVRICSGQLSFRMRRQTNIGGADNDIMLIGAAPFDGSTFPHLSRSLWDGYRQSSQGADTLELTAELFANVQRAYAADPQAFLDVYAADDTSFDFITLLIVY